MRIMMVGPGRAGTALGMAWQGSSHDIVAMVGRDQEHANASARLIGCPAVGIDDDLPSSELIVIAVRDDAIGSVARSLSGRVSAATVHVSGLKSVHELSQLEATGVSVGSFHPLQTIPTPEAGVRHLGGAWVAVTAGSDALRNVLESLARDIGARPFILDDGAKALYHAAAAAAANFTLAPLALAHTLFTEAGVPWEAARPLVEAIVANAFDLGPTASLTGPIARGDLGTVTAQLSAVAEQVPERLDEFWLFVQIVARLAGREDEFEQAGPS